MVASPFESAVVILAASVLSWSSIVDPAGAFVTMTVCARAAPAPAVTLSAQTHITNHKSLIDIRVLEAGSPDELTRQHIISTPHAVFAQELAFGG